MAAKNHVSRHGYYPSSGWGYKWIGDPNRGFGRRQPGGWTYSTLPFIEQENVWNIGKGMSGAALSTELVKVQQAVVGTFICPSRRQPKLYPSVSWYPESHNTDYPTGGTAKTDYAGNGGEVIQTYGGPPTGATEPSLPGWEINHTGMTHLVSQVQDGHIRDGTTSTYWAGEKYLNPDQYQTGDNGADNGSLFQGHDWDNLRWGHASYPPRRDKPGAECWRCFGSPHPAGTNFVMCDGSVHMISHNIDGDVHRRLSNREDGEAVDVTKL